VFTGTGTDGSITGGNCNNWTAGVGKRCRFRDGIYCFEQ